MLKYMHMQKGISTLESILFILFLLVAAGIVFIMLNPILNVNSDPNDQAWANVLTISNAIQVNKIDYQGRFLPSIRELDTNKAYLLSFEVEDSQQIKGDCREELIGFVDISQLITGGYLVREQLSLGAGYFLKKNENDQLTIGVCANSGEVPIEVTR